MNGTKPLAAWLRDNGSLMSANFLSPAKGDEVAEPAQMTYTFSLQASGGLDAKYTLTTIKWSPLAVEASGSLQQNSIVAVYINGPKAAFANGAKGGQSGFGPPQPALGSIGNPMYVVEKNGNAVPPPRKGDFLPSDGTQPGQEPAPRRRARGPAVPRRTGETPYFIAPLPITPPSMTPSN